MTTAGQPHMPQPVACCYC